MKRILVARLDKVGDTVLSTPFFHNLRQNFPEAEIVALTSEYNREVLQGNPDVSQIVSLPHQPQGEFDMAVALSPTAQTYRTVFATKAPTRLGIVYASRLPNRVMSRWWLTRPTVVDVDGPLRRGRPVMHEVRQMLSVLRDSGLAVKECPLTVYPSAEQRAAAQTMLRDHPVLGIHLSIRWFTEGWTLPDFFQVLDVLRAAFPQDRWLVTHGPAERELATGLQERPGVVVAGERDFGTWAALIGRCRGYVSTDTGALHVASALQVPVVAVYEASTFEHCSQQWAPWMSPHEKLRKGAVLDTANAVVVALRRLLEGT